jgi:hypothetical protein
LFTLASKKGYLSNHGSKTPAQFYSEHNVPEEERISDPEEEIGDLFDLINASTQQWREEKIPFFVDNLKIVVSYYIDFNA